VRRLDVPSLLRAIDGSEGLRRYLETRDPEAMKLVAVFRKRMGDRCNYVKAALERIWYQEVTRGSGDIEPHLRAANYPS
jgi:hypothetical protein